MRYRRSVRKIARAKPYLAVAALCTVAVLAAMASATVLQAHLTQSTSGKVLLNEFTLSSGGFPLEWLFQQLHEAEALDVIRMGLLRQERIRDFPILVLGAGEGPVLPRNSGSSMEEVCEVYPDGDSPRPIGKCYLIYRTAAPTYQDLLEMTVALASLSPTRRRIDVADFSAFRAAWSTAMLTFKGLVQHFDPIWSPDGRLLLYTVWEDGQVQFALMDPITRGVRRLPPLQGYMSTRPLWSPDSRWVAYASSMEIRLYDTQTGTESRLLPAALHQRVFYRLLLAFQGTNLVILLPTWEFAYDVTRHELRQVRMGGQRPPWARERDTEDPVTLHASLRPTPSPTGRHIAEIILVDGRRVLEVTPRR